METNDPNEWQSDPANIELLNFLIERTKDAKSPLTYDELAKEYKNDQWCGRFFFKHRVRFLVGKVGKMETIDNVTKLKICFVLSGYMNKHLLEELRKDAYVEVDEYGRVTKYISNDGSLILEGQHQASEKSRARKKYRGSEGSRSSESTTKRPRIEDSEDSGSFEHSNQEPLSGSMDILSHHGVEEPPNSIIQEFREPKREIESPEALGAPETTVVQAEAVQRAPEAPEASAPAPEASRPQSGLNNAYTPQIKFLEAIQSLILTLDMPSLSPLQEKIEKKLRESSPNEKIPNDEMILAMELLMARITNNSVFDLPENVESVALKEFLCYLKAAIMNSKLEGLEGLLEKIKERIKEPALKDKNIPVEKVTRAVQDTLNNVGF